MEMNQLSTSSSHQGTSRPSPGLTLESLSFKNFPMKFKQKQKKERIKDKIKEPNPVKYQKLKKDEELKRNLINYEQYLEKNLHYQKKSSKQTIPFPQKTDLYYPKNYKNSNAEILSKILDSKREFSPNSPSNLKVCTKEIKEIHKENKQRNIINKEKNKENNNKNIKENKNSNFDSINKKLNINQSDNSDNIKQSYIDALAQTLKLIAPVFESLSLIEKIQKLLGLTEDERKPIRLGSLVALYIILKKYTNEINDEQSGILIKNIISLLENYQSQEELFLIACLEICTLYGKVDILIENISLICMFITDFNHPKLQRASFNCMMSIGPEGIKALVELASKDYQEYQNYILNNLIQTPYIQKIIIIAALLNEIYSNNSQRRNIALAALNRMHNLLNDSENLEKISPLFDDPKVNKEFIASILRTSGIEGEAILLNELKNNKDPNVRIAIANVLSYRLHKVPYYLNIKLDKNDTYSVSNNLPGSFCTFYGKISACIENKKNSIEDLLEDPKYGDLLETDSNIIKQETKEQDEYLLINTRDFLAALMRMISMNSEFSDVQIVHSGNLNTLDNIDLKSTESEIINQNIAFFDYGNANIEHTKDHETHIDEKGRYFISDNVIKALVRCLKDYSPKVRETAATSIGMIGIPEGILAIDGLIKAIDDEDVNVKSKVIWAIGRIAEETEDVVIPYIVESVKCNMWKVKKASLYALRQLGDRCARQSLEYLTKLLKESPINKQLIAATMTKLGHEGESKLLKLMSQEPDSNYKLKSAIIVALSLTDINSSNIDFIVEYIFKQGKNANSIVRRSAIYSISKLAQKADEKKTYLKRKNVIPFYYDKLKDKDPEVQTAAINSIRALGPQGELIFIEGLTKDPNPIIRANCAIGLGENGVHNIRTLLNGLHDDSSTVRNTVEKVLVSKMGINDVIRHFDRENSGNQIKSLEISIKDVLEKNYPIDMFTINYLNQLLNEIGKYEMNSKEEREEEEDIQESISKEKGEK